VPFNQQVAQGAAHTVIAPDIEKQMQMMLRFPNHLHPGLLDFRHTG